MLLFIMYIMGIGKIYMTFIVIKVDILPIPIIYVYKIKGLLPIPVFFRGRNPNCYYHSMEIGLNFFESAPDPACFRVVL